MLSCSNRVVECIKYQKDHFRKHCHKLQILLCVRQYQDCAIYEKKNRKPGKLITLASFYNAKKNIERLVGDEKPKRKESLLKIIARRQVCRKHLDKFKQCECLAFL